jgi:hypothetical protein
MALILPIQDRTKSIHNQAFMKASVLIESDQPMARIKLSFWSSFNAYKNGGEKLFGNNDIWIEIQRSSTFFQNNFSTPVIILAGKSPTLNLYEVLKTMDGTEEGVLVDDVVLHQLLGINFTNAIDSFTQQEFDLSIDGLLNPSDAKIIFIEDTEQYKVYSSAESSWFNT